MRDIMKRIEEGRSILREHPRMDLRSPELEVFHKMYDQRLDLSYVIVQAFWLGVSVGARSTR